MNTYSAGCPMAVEDEHGDKPLIPDVAGMTEELTKRLDGSDDADAFAKLRMVLVEDDNACADLEYMLSLVRALRDVAGAGGARGLSREELERLDDAISNEVAQLARPLLPKPDTPYHDVMRWVGGTARDDPVEVFTTNYDLLSEQALEEVGFPTSTGSLARTSRSSMCVRSGTTRCPRGGRGSGSCTARSTGASRQGDPSCVGRRPTASPVA